MDKHFHFDSKKTIEIYSMEMKIVIFTIELEIFPGFPRENLSSILSRLKIPLFDTDFRIKTLYSMNIVLS